MTFPLTVSLLLSSALLASPIESGAQQVLDLDTFDVCSDCNIARVELAVLGEEAGEGLLNPGRLVHGPQGEFVVVPPGGTRVQVFDREGQYIRTIGGRGEGPGEFQMIVRAAMSDSTLHVLDLQRRRLVSLGLDGEFMAETAISPAEGELAVPLPDTAVVAYMDRSPDRAGLPLHLVEISSGSTIHSTGSRSGGYVRRSSLDDRFMINPAPGNESAVWFGRQSELRVIRWDVSQDAVEIEARGAPEWFPRVTEEFDGTSPPPTLLASFVVDRDERLWTLTWIAAPDWEQHVEVDRRLTHGYRLRDGAQIRHARLDMYDLRTGAHVRGPVWDDTGKRLSLSHNGDPLIYHTIWEDEGLIEKASIERLRVEPGR